MGCDYLLLFCKYCWPNFLNKQDNFICCNNASIESKAYAEGLIRPPADSIEMHSSCMCQLIGEQDEIIQLYVEEFSLSYPVDDLLPNQSEWVGQIHKKDKKKVDFYFVALFLDSCRHIDSLCFKFFNGNSAIRQVQPNRNSYDQCICGSLNSVPKQIISNGNQLSIMLRMNLKSHILKQTNHLSDHQRNMIRSNGFLLRFKFIKQMPGKHISRMKWAFQVELVETPKKGSICKFEYSSSEFKNGYFTSPGYPGLYPRNVNCEYYFYGTKFERVFITFHTFDVEGIDQ